MAETSSQLSGLALQSLLGPDELVVLRMGSDPDPEDRIRIHPAERPMVIADANCEPVSTTLQPPEMKRRMVRISPPEPIILPREILHVRWQIVEQLPKSAGSDGLHLAGGQSRRSPWLDSASASSKRKSSLWDWESASSCAFQSAWSRSRNHCAIRLNSSGGRPSIAASISSTRSIPEV